MLFFSTFIIAFFATSTGISEPIHVRLAIFSGRPDPQWQILPNSPNYQAIQQLVIAARNGKQTYSPEKMPAQLGYRGFLLKIASATVAELILGPETMKLQKLLLQTIPGNIMSEKTKSILSIIIEKSKSPVMNRMKRAAPDFVTPWFNNPWNHNPVMANSNCYSYANDKKKEEGDFARPGRGSGQAINIIVPGIQDVPFSGEDVRRAAEHDGLWILQDEYTPAVNTPFKLPPSQEANRHLVALFVDETVDGNDFHWYRLDSNNFWSHKIGGGMALQIQAGQDIRDPRTATMPLHWPNYQFVCFMTTNRNTVTIA